MRSAYLMYTGTRQEWVGVARFPLWPNGGHALWLAHMSYPFLWLNNNAPINVSQGIGHKQDRWFWTPDILALESLSVIAFPAQSVCIVIICLSPADLSIYLSICLSIRHSIIPEWNQLVGLVKVWVWVWVFTWHNGASYLFIIKVLPSDCSLTFLTYIWSRSSPTFYQLHWFSASLHLFFGLSFLTGTS